MFQKVLVCTDFTDGLQRLVGFVPQLAESGIKQITFLHVLPLDTDRTIPKPDPEKERQVRARLAVDQDAAGGVEIRVEVQWGRPMDVILQYAQAGAVDLILMGTPIRSQLTEKLFGSTLVSVCQRSAVPVMLFRPQLLSVYTNEELALRCRHLFRYLLVPYDSSRAAEYLVQQIRQRADQDNVLKQCLLTWVITEGGRRGLPKDYQIEEAKPKLAAAKSVLESANLTVETEILRGEPIPEILLAAIDYDISAIAISSERFGKLSELSTPSFAGELLRRSGHPLIYFPVRRGAG